MEKQQNIKVHKPSRQEVLLGSIQNQYDLLHSPRFLFPMIQLRGRSAGHHSWGDAHRHQLLE